MHGSCSPTFFCRLRGFSAFPSLAVCNGPWGRNLEHKKCDRASTGLHPIDALCFPPCTPSAAPSPSSSHLCSILSTLSPSFLGNIAHLHTVNRLLRSTVRPSLLPRNAGCCGSAQRGCTIAPAAKQNARGKRRGNDISTPLSCFASPPSRTKTTAVRSTE
jgi:hypothetical protein